MTQRDFNRDMDDYLRRRGSDGGIFGKLKKNMPKVKIIEDEEQAAPADVPMEHVQMVMRGESVPQDEMDEEFESPKEYSPKATFWKRWFSWFVFDEEGHLVEEVDIELPVEEVKPKVDSDVKDMLRICVQWINRLPPADIQEIRRSDEYVKFKQLLDRYGLLKK